jgi:hypothetical protein
VHQTGNVGEIVTLPDGREVQRLEELHKRRYVSIFGTFTLERSVYGSREGQALEFVPFDNRLQLPESAFSQVLQDWDQSLAMEQPFAQVNQTIERAIPIDRVVPIAPKPTPGKLSEFPLTWPARAATMDRSRKCAHPADE